MAVVRISTILGMLLPFLIAVKTDFVEYFEQGGNVVAGGEMKYYGCFRDYHSRDLEVTYHKLSLKNSLTPESCHYLCTHIIPARKVAGMENGRECYCGDDFGKYGQVDELVCEKPCAGDRQQTCGGVWALSIYSAETFQTDPPTTGGYMGCLYQNDAINGARISLTQTNSPAECIKRCFDKNYNYAGVQLTTCMCGSTYGGKYAPAAGCNARCVGNSRKICGARDRISLYFTRKATDYDQPNEDLD